MLAILLSTLFGVVDFLKGWGEVEIEMTVAVIVCGQPFPQLIIVLSMMRFWDAICLFKIRYPSVPVFYTWFCLVGPPEPAIDSVILFVI